ncbi:MAG: decarboxylating NADP(+)-dependent phosphogluconate dehydrogenase, partial [Acidimicrobiia bacterium]|nr:decarboxylating NADP(+)-dependent phosphogluconate dehydrogenase [Acidimicrobiia bacterium]
MSASADIGVIGLAVMGRNLIMNMDDHGFTVAAYNRTTERVDEFLAGDAAGSNVVGVGSLEQLVEALKPPRRVMLMIKAGKPVDATIDSLIPLLDDGDIIIDGGNSLYTDTIARTKRVEAAGLRFIGTGVSGGEEGARRGPSIMPGGSEEAWPFVKDIFQSIAASVDEVPCCDWVGADGAGHYVKMVHNGIEYGDMQVIAEAYDIMHRGLGMTHEEMHEVFAEWDRGKLDSYLIEITTDIMAFRDEDGSPLLEKILDAAGQKGTGKWTVISSMELGQPMTLVAEAVYGRIVSALKDQRVSASEVLGGPEPVIGDDRDAVLADLHDALYASKITSYAQGFMLMDAAADEYGWDLDFSSIASMWRGGCIIRSRFLGEVMTAYGERPELRSLLLNPFFAGEVEGAQAGWRRTIQRAVAAGIAVPAYSSALAFYDGYRTSRVPAN